MFGSNRFNMSSAVAFLLMIMVGPLISTSNLLSTPTGQPSRLLRRRLHTLTSLYRDPRTVELSTRVASGHLAASSDVGVMDKTLMCCHPGSLNSLDDKFTTQYFESGKLQGGLKGNEEKEWQTIRSKFQVNHGNGVVEPASCAAQWTYLVLENANGFYLRSAFEALANTNISENIPSFRYTPPTPGLPRVLVLGDSISRGIWTETQNIINSSGLRLSVQGAPTNCGGFPLYGERLSRWLGDCQWDLVQFNVGMHYHSSSLAEYSNELSMVVESIREHSPAAQIVFALTTPSPFDSNTTWPTSSCKNYGLFHKSGFVPKLNEEAVSSLSKINVTINDRYSVIHRELEKYQFPCDVHFTELGYALMAKQDLRVFADILGLDPIPNL